jgi:membrane-bound lytic murein transglycosylase A
MSRLTSLALSLSVLALLAGCARKQMPPPKDYWAPLEPGAPALRLVTDPARLPDFRPAFDSDRASLLKALDLSIRYLTYPSSGRYFPVQAITHDRAQRSLAAFREMLTKARTADELHQGILAKFDVYESVGCDNEGTVLFTGYYTPIFEASLKPVGPYQWPLYKLPADLVKAPDGQCQGRRLPDGGIVPYYTRKEIDGGALKGQELVYLKDRFAAYICTVQGSAKLKLPDGTWFNVGYAGNNGMEYTSVGQLLVNDGLIPRDKLSLSTLMAYFRSNPDKMEQYLPRNERYVFFQKTDLEPTGSLNLAVTPYRSLATDKALFPRACLCFVKTKVPDVSASGGPVHKDFSQFMLDQDTGGAIRAAGRADIYIGVGDRAGRVAGWTFSEGRLYYLFLKEQTPPTM